MGFVVQNEASETMAATVVRPGGPARDSSAASEAPRGAEPRLGWYARAKFGIVRGFLWAWTSLFQLRGLYLLGRFFGTCEYLVNFKRRARFRRELLRIFRNGLSRRREQVLVRSYFCRTRCDKLLYLIFDKLPKEKIIRRIRFAGREIVDEALARGNGMYVLLSHNGSHHVAGLLMALLGYRCAGIRDRNEGAIRIYVQEKYAETFPEFRSIRVLYADSFPREIYRCFRDNFVVGSALDVSRVRGVQLKTCKVRFLGEQRDFLTGTLQIALRTHSTVAQAFVVSRRNYYFRLIVNPPLYVPGATPPADEEALVPQILQQYADGIETHLREHPDHLSRV